MTLPPIRPTGELVGRRFLSRTRIDRVAIWLVVALASNLAAATVIPPTQLADRPPSAVEAFLDRTAESLGRNEASVIARLGEPLTRSVDRGFNQHERNSGLDLVTLYYRG